MNLKLFFILCSLIFIFLAGFIFANEKIDINIAPLENLIKIKHIGEVRAKEIISSRPFYSLDDLIKIKGIGEKTLEDIKEQGLAWVDPALQTKAPNDFIETREINIGPTPITETNSKIDINIAPLEDLIKIRHIGEARAQSLISLRPFYSLDDLIEIRGIGEKTLEDIKEQGLAWVDPKLELERPKIEKKINLLEKRVAMLAQTNPINLNKGSASVFPIALILAIFSGTIIIILRKLIDKNT